MRHLCLLVFIGLLTFSAAAAQEEVDLTSNLEASINPETVQPLAQFGWGHPRDLAWMPDGKSFAVATAAGVYFYDSADILAAPRFFETGAQPLDAIAISPDGKYLATGGDDVYLWDISTGVVVDEMRAGNGVTDVAFSPDGSLLAATKTIFAQDIDCGLYVFNVVNGRQQFSYLDDYNYFSNIEFLPDNQSVAVIISGNGTGISNIINIQTGDIKGLSFADFHRQSPNGDSLFTYYRHDGFFRFNPAEPNKAVSEARYHTTYLTEIGLLPGAKQFFSLTQEGELAWWDSETLEQVGVVDTGFPNKIAATSPDGSRLVAVDKSGLLRLMDTQTGEIIAERQHRIVDSTLLTFIGEWLVYADNNTNNIWLWNPYMMGPVVFAGHQDEVTAITGSLTSVKLYTASRDGTVRVWNMAHGDEIRQVAERRNTPISAMILGNASDFYIATCPENGMGQVEHLDLQTGASLGFYGAEKEKRMLKPFLEIEHGCSDHMMSQGDDLIYIDWQGFYWIEGNGLDTLRSFGLPFEGLSNPVKLYIVDSEKNLFVLAYRGTAFMWLPYYPSELYILFSHSNEITALAKLDYGNYVSAACEGYSNNGYGDVFCYGTEMVITETDFGFDYQRTNRYPLNAHGEIVNQIVANKATMDEDSNLFASASEDGTVILWGSPKEPVEMKLYIDG